MTDTPETTALYEEHLLLGASMAPIEETDLLVPMGYPGSDEASVEGSTLLFDLTGLPYGLLSGPEAQNVAEMTFAGPCLEVGECAFEPALFGDGSLVGLPLVLRTGEHEYCLLDLLGADDACMEWALYLTNFIQDGQRLFPGTTLEDATEFLLPLLMWGSDAPLVLNDYLSDGVTLPAPGTLVSCKLDKIPAIIAALPALSDAYLVLVPPQCARIIWRSFLSFSCLEPAGLVDLKRELMREIPWSELAADRAKATASSLTAHQLIRTGGQFVGMRGLLEG